MTISRKRGVKVGVEDIWRNKVIKKEINGGGGGSGVLKLSTEGKHEKNFMGDQWEGVRKTG